VCSYCTTKESREGGAALLRGVATLKRTTRLSYELLVASTVDANLPQTGLALAYAGLVARPRLHLQLRARKKVSE